ncbi:hypothetical protein AVEN_271006-1, partial [Araneus ventricosus]
MKWKTICSEEKCNIWKGEHYGMMMSCGRRIGRNNNKYNNAR